MNHSLKRAMLTAAAFAAITSPLSGAQAQSGYSYLFWPFFTPAPAPARAPAVSAPNGVAASAAMPQHAQAENTIHEAADLREMRVPEAPRALSGSTPQSVMIGVGF